MRENTPPRSPLDELVEDGESDDELIYAGDADEVLDAWERDMNHWEEEAGIEEAEEAHTPHREPAQDDARLTFSKHTSSVFCCDLHPTEELAVTGGEDDKAYVWSTRTGEVVHEVTNHGDSVVAVGFSYDGVFVATGDMAGYIQVFKVSQGYRKVWELTVGDIGWMRWHMGAHVLMAGCESGEVYVWRIPSGDCKVLPGNDIGTEAAELTHDGKKLLVGYQNGQVKLWDLKLGTPILEVDSTVGHKGNVTTVAVDQESQLFMTGCEDGSLCLMGPNGVLAQLEQPNPNPIEAVLIDYPGFEIKVAASGTLDGKLTIWDAARQTRRVVCEDDDPVGIIKLLWLKDYIICAGTVDGLIKGWDFRSGAKRFVLEGHKNIIQSIAYDKQRNVILSTSEDGTAKIYDVPTGQ
uniref:Uncharacterized protein n=1 Tax=Anopheles epiroticus TaxID=199890 RepID=A0A182PAX4_9DIPT